MLILTKNLTDEGAQNRDPILDNGSKVYCVLLGNWAKTFSRSGLYKSLHSACFDQRQNLEIQRR